MTNPVSPIPQTQPQNRPILSRFHLQAEQARHRLHTLVQQAWHVLEPQTRLIDGIHLQAMCEHLQAVTEGRIKNLIINVPPGHAKSLLTAVFWLAWVWISHPEAHQHAALRAGHTPRARKNRAALHERRIWDLCGPAGAGCRIRNENEEE